MSKQRRIEYLDSIKTIAITCVVTIHVCARLFSEYKYGSIEWNICNLFDAFSRCGVPLFMMVTGALLVGRDDNTVENSWKKRILRTFRIFIVWSSVYAAIDCVQWITNGADVITSIKSAVIMLINGHYHLWYLWALMGMYALLPLLNGIARQNAHINYFIILSFCLAIVVPTIQNLISLEAITIIDSLNMHMVVGYPLYFLLGYKLHNMKLPFDWIKWALTMIIAGGVLTFILELKYSADSIAAWPYGYFTINVFIETIGWFILMKMLHDSPRFINIIISKISLSKNTMGIYLIHIMILDILDYSGMLRMEKSFIMIPIFVAVILFTSNCITSFIKKWKLISWVVK